jgi:hypothetical protein
MNAFPVRSIPFSIPFSTTNISKAGTRVFFWASNAKIVYGTVQSTSRMPDACIINYSATPLTLNMFFAGNTGISYQGRQRKNRQLAVSIRLYFCAPLIAIVGSAAGITKVS